MLAPARLQQQALRLRHLSRTAYKAPGIALNRQNRSSFHNVSSLHSPRLRSQQPFLFTRPNAFNSRRFQSTSAGTTTKLLESSASSELLPDSATGDVFEQLSQTASTTAQAVEPHIGMLKEAGLDFGWGTTAIAQWIVEHLHVSMGLPWWAALVGCALAYRVVLFYPAMRSSHQTALASHISPAMREINDRWSKADVDPMQRQAGQQQELRYLRKQTGYKMTAQFIPIILQGWISFGLFRLTRNLCPTDGLGMSEGGLLWFTNLQVVDPLYILPIATAVVMHMMARSQVRRQELMAANPLAAMPWMKAVMFWGLPAITFMFLSNQPAGVALPMSILSITTASTQTTLQNPRFRRMLRLQQFPHGPPKRIDVRGRLVGDYADKRGGGPMEAMAAQMGGVGMGMTKNKSKLLEEVRGKEALAKARAFDEKRKKQRRAREERNARDAH